MTQEKLNTLNKQRKVIDKINKKWQELQKDFYICYSVKELAYKIAYDLSTELGNNTEIQIFYKLYNGKHKIMFEIENGVWFVFDIFFATGMFGDNGLHINNGQMTNELRNGYKDIENVLEE